MPRQLSSLDKLLSLMDEALRTLSGHQASARPVPAVQDEHAELSAQERRLSGALMRVNHVGEVCAQALYQSQGHATSNPALRAQFAAASREETDHLVWTEQRLRELGSRPSLLNPLWYAGAFAIGLAAGRRGDGTSLGFVAETEKQVAKHLENHLARLPATDTGSRAIVRQMMNDEAQHARDAERAGAHTLPWPVRLSMKSAAKVMTTVAHYV